VERQIGAAGRCNRFGSGNAESSDGAPKMCVVSTLRSGPMPEQIYVFDAELVDFTDVRRTIAIRRDQTLDDLHQTLRAAFAWDDEHLYSFWLKGGFWARNGSEYTHPLHAAHCNLLTAAATSPAPKSADVRLGRLKLRSGQRVAYVHDFGDEWRVALKLRQITADDGGAYPRLLDQVGDAPPQYPAYDEDETPRDRTADRASHEPIVAVAGDRMARDRHA
jgi:hypothetical protein